MTRAALGLGANQGDPRTTLHGAVAGLSAHPGVDVLAVSGLWQTAAVGGPEQPDYLNAVIVVQTSLDPQALLSLAHDLEEAAGRVRDVRWGPRTLDVDLVTYEGVVGVTDDLELPHPRAHERAFVLVPWAEVAPEWVLIPAGGEGRSVRSWAEAARAEHPDGAVVRVEGGVWWR